MSSEARDTSDQPTGPAGEEQSQPTSDNRNDGRLTLVTTVGSIIIGILGVISGITGQVMQHNSTQAQIASEERLRTLEITFERKQENYAAVLRLMSDAYNVAISTQDPASTELEQTLSKLETAYYELEPFLGEKREDAAVLMVEFQSYCLDLETKNLAEMSEEEISEVSNQFGEYGSEMRDLLYPRLFGNQASSFSSSTYTESRN